MAFRHNGKRTQLRTASRSQINITDELKAMTAVVEKITYREFLEKSHSGQVLSEEYSYYIFRTDTNAVLARGVPGFEAAKEKANQLRKSHGLKWDMVKFKVERAQKLFGVSADGKTFTNAYGQQGRMDYARNYNPSKGRRFSGYYDQQGNYHGLD